MNFFLIRKVTAFSFHDIDLSVEKDEKCHKKQIYVAESATFISKMWQS